jgi:hypothetical protein
MYYRYAPDAEAIIKKYRIALNENKTYIFVT